jgi:hypothetical protein
VLADGRKRRENLWNVKTGRKTDVLTDKTIPVPLCAPKLDWIRTQEGLVGQTGD